MFQPLRTAISVAVLGLGLWAAFAIDLGGKTFAEHVDTISETPEAKQLIDGTRATINPALVEVRDRVLGEYVEAPTWIPESETVLSSTNPGAGEPGEPAKGARAAAKPATTRAPGPSEPPLPGRRAGRKAPGGPTPSDSRAGAEPPLPGRR